MKWGDGTAIVAPDIRPPTMYVTARGKQTRQHFQQERRHARGNPHRRLLTSIIIEAAGDYHRAKRLCESRGVKSKDDFHLLSDDCQQIVMHGWKAFEWFTSPPHGEHPNKVTYGKLGSLLGLRPDRLWEALKATPSVATLMGNARSADA